MSHPPPETDVDEGVVMPRETPLSPAARAVPAVSSRRATTPPIAAAVDREGNVPDQRESLGATPRRPMPGGRVVDCLARRRLSGGGRS